MDEQLYFLGVKAVLQNQGKILLLQEDRGNGPYWSLPGGRVNQGETIEETLHRELLEETGLTEITIKDTLGTYVTNITIKEYGLIMTAILCETTTTKIVTEPDAAYKWFDIDEACTILSQSLPTDMIAAIRAIGH